MYAMVILLREMKCKIHFIVELAHALLIDSHTSKLNQQSKDVSKSNAEFGEWSGTGSYHLDSNDTIIDWSSITKR